ncbi:predicted GPI-anchored protein 58 [Nannospalax galili]|uniref:predicted GPI-anchored protein 58 n=1 Tax=Nannospalax galili TaxID=1026970 RepID=UPI0004ED0822|nr:predicted GPI-anchored protein 58 [Nannospalax galili]
MPQISASAWVPPAQAAPQATLGLVSHASVLLVPSHLSGPSTPCTFSAPWSPCAPSSPAPPASPASLLPPGPPAHSRSPCTPSSPGPLVLCSPGSSPRAPIRRLHLWIPRLPCLPRNSTSPRAAPRAGTRSFERRGPAGSAPTRRPDWDGPGRQPEPRAPTVVAHLTSAAPAAPLRLPPRLRLEPRTPAWLRPLCSVLPCPAWAASAASRDRTAPAAPAGLARLAAGHEAPPLSPLDAADWARPAARWHAP